MERSAVQTEKGEKRLVIERRGRRAHIWLPLGAEGLDPAVEQNVHEVLAFPYLAGDFVLMPDHHLGYGVPIGSVLPTDQAVIPYAIGVDIGCGMCSFKTSVDLNRFGDWEDRLHLVVERLKKTIPVGFNSKQEPSYVGRRVSVDEVKALIGADRFDPYHFSFKAAKKLRFDPAFWEKNMRKFALQMGTLGGGNHFIELQVDQYGMLWVTIHSGSRNLGYTMCNLFTAAARNLYLERGVPFKRDLSPLMLSEKEGRAYLAVHDICCRAAKRNRADMMYQVVRHIDGVFGTSDQERVRQWALREVSLEEEWKVGDEESVPFDMPHNFGRFEYHQGRRVFIHRKGATPATPDQLVIVPGAMNTKSYICVGLGSEESYQSSAHGAGRKLGRREAIRTIPDKVAHDDLRGIITSFNPARVKDELGRAYKDVDSVIGAEKSLVRVLYELKPLASVKG